MDKKDEGRQHQKTQGRALNDLTTLLAARSTLANGGTIICPPRRTQYVKFREGKLQPRFKGEEWTSQQMNSKQSAKICSQGLTSSGIG